MNDKTRGTLNNLAAHADKILESITDEWPEDEAKSDPMERSDRLHLLAAVRNLGICARRAADRRKDARDL